MNRPGKDSILTLSILLTASFFLFSALSLKPPHADEGVNGFFVNQIWENGFFTYDPTNYHGPLLFYLFQISEKVFGFGIHSFRIVTACSTLLSIWFILRSRNALGNRAHFFIAAALAVSPGMIFFGRSAIHESPFVLFQILWMIGFVRLREHLDRKGILWFGAGLLGCILLKETFVILGLSFLLAWGWLEVSPKILGSRKQDIEHPPHPDFKKLDRGFVLETVLAALGVWLVLFAGFFHHWPGVPDFFTAVTPWLKTGVRGSGHEKPFLYWTALIWRYEWVAGLGVPIACAGLFHRVWRLRFFSSLALINGLIYSLIPYKTPWCIISIAWPFAFAAGLWFGSIFAGSGLRNSVVLWLSLAVTAVAFTHSALTAYRLNFVDYTNPMQPYVYVQTKNDLKTLDRILREKVSESPHFQNMVLEIAMKDPWPLPWYFSRYPNLRFGDYRTSPPANADVILAEASVDNRNLTELYRRRTMELRDAREPFAAYLKRSTFEGMVLPGFNIVRPQAERL